MHKSSILPRTDGAIDEKNGASLAPPGRPHLLLYPVPGTTYQVYELLLSVASVETKVYQGRQRRCPSWQLHHTMGGAASHSSPNLLLKT